MWRQSFDGFRRYCQRPRAWCWRREGGGPPGVGSGESRPPWLAQTKVDLGEHWELRDSEINLNCRLSVLFKLFSMSTFYDRHNSCIQSSAYVVLRRYVVLCVCDGYHSESGEATMTPPEVTTSQSMVASAKIRAQEHSPLQSRQR
jgi:hypothetical protein